MPKPPPPRIPRTRRPFLRLRSPLRAVLTPLAFLPFTTCLPPATQTPARASTVWTYDVEISPDGHDLHVDATFPPGVYAELRVEDDAGRFVTDVSSQIDDTWRPTPPGSLTCEPEGCHIRYRFRLGAAARAFADPDVAMTFGSVIVSPPSTWLVHPADIRPDAYRIRVTSGAEVFLPSLPPTREPATYEARESGFHEAPYFAFGPWRRHTVEVAGSRILVGIAPALPVTDDEPLVQWLTRSAQALAAYLHGFSSRYPLIAVVPGRKGSVYGRTLGGGGGSVLLRVAPGARPERTADAWVPLHEMVHLNLPSLGYPHQWLEEGIATYVEPIARARAGMISPDDVWRDLVKMAPNGLPGHGDDGLERTHTWGRTYWGGALYCLMADVEIRARTNNAHSFDDVLRAIVASGASVAERWELSRVLDAGEKATGTPVLRELYARYGLAPGAPDLPALWARLGVTVKGTKVAYDDQAPLAAVRKAITTP